MYTQLTLSQIVIFSVTL